MSERKTIYLCLAHMSEEGYEQKYVKEAFDTNWVVPLGPNVNAFEEDLRKFVTGNEESAVYGDSRWPETNPASWHLNEALKDTKVVCLSAGTGAVHLALLACGVGPGDEVCVQSFTFCASSHPITYCGAKPVFIGSEKETWNMDPVLLEEAIKDRIAKTGKKPKAIVPVALYGMPYRIDKIMEIANRYEIPVVEDAAEGMGSRYNGQVLGTFGRYGVLSFNGNKMITTSGGGALICRNAEEANQVMWLATQARDSYPYYQHTAIGFNYRMSNVCAGIGRGQMNVLNAHIAHHKHVQALYEELFKDIPGITIHKQPTTGEYDSNFWLCTMTLDPQVKIKGQENAYKTIVHNLNVVLCGFLSDFYTLGVRVALNLKNRRLCLNRLYKIFHLIFVVVKIADSERANFSQSNGFFHILPRAKIVTRRLMNIKQIDVVKLQARKHQGLRI